MQEDEPQEISLTLQDILDAINAIFDKFASSRYNDMISSDVTSNIDVDTPPI